MMFLFYCDLAFLYLCSYPRVVSLMCEVGAEWGAKWHRSRTEWERSVCHDRDDIILAV